MTVSVEAVTTTVLSDHPCQLGEGSTYDAASDTAWWFDITGKTLFEHRFVTGETVLHPLPFMASQLSFVDEDRQLVFAENGLHVREIATGRLTLHTPLEADNSVTRSNDGRVHPSGALWIGTMGKQGEPQAGAIYWFYGGMLKPLYSDITTPNAICFAPDGATAYFTDTETGVLLRVATEPETGMPVGEPSVLSDTQGRDGGPDGAVVDAEGVIWNARWGAGRIDAYSPTGALVRSLQVPASRPTCPVFVGAAADRMLVTTARQGLSEAELRDEPGAGQTFVLDFAVKGRREPRVALA